MEVQFQNLKNNDPAQFKDPTTEVILWPPQLKTGDLDTPTPSNSDQQPRSTRRTVCVFRVLCGSYSLMPEVPHPGEYHRHAGGIGRGNHLFVAH